MITKMTKVRKGTVCSERVFKVVNERRSVSRCITGAIIFDGRE